jgi:hypothetical protein
VKSAGDEAAEKDEDTHRVDDEDDGAPRNAAVPMPFGDRNSPRFENFIGEPP